MKKSILLFISLFVISTATVYGQTTAFTYQGKLTDGGAPANGLYDLSFKLFTQVSGGSQTATDVVKDDVQVTNGIFSVTLDFGSSPFTSQNGNFLEIGVRPGTGTGAFTTLNPRQQVASSPYAVQTIRAQSAAVADNANALGGVPAASFVQTSDPRLSDSRPPTAGSTNYIQNNPPSPQSSSSFNISGNGIVGSNLAVNGGTSVLGNLGIGTVNPQFKLHVVGQDIRIQGSSPSVVPRFSLAHTGAVGIGTDMGKWQNYVFYQSPVGGLRFSALNDAETQENIWMAVGRGSGIAVPSIVFPASDIYAERRLLVGPNLSIPVARLYVREPSTGTGMRVEKAFTGDLLASFGGNGAFQVDSAGVPGGRFTIQENGNVGIGTGSPQFGFHIVRDNVRIEGNTPATFPRVSFNFTGGGADAKKWQNYATTNALRFGSLNDAETFETVWLNVVRSGQGISRVEFTNGDVVVSGKVLVGVSSSPDLLAVNGTVSIGALGSAGSTTLCRNDTNQISTCSSSLRYKTNIRSFSPGMAFVKKLRPITYDWKGGGMKDVGFGAEDLAKIDPRFVTYNDKGKVEGIKYDRLGVVFVNALREQQEQITEQQKQIANQATVNAELREQVKLLKTLICAQNRRSPICR